MTGKGREVGTVQVQQVDVNSSGTNIDITRDSNPFTPDQPLLVDEIPIFSVVHELFHR